MPAESPLTQAEIAELAAKVERFGGELNDKERGFLAAVIARAAGVDDAEVKGYIALADWSGSGDEAPEERSGSPKAPLLTTESVTLNFTKFVKAGWD